MPSIAKPIVTHPSLRRNELGFTIRDYEGAMSTLCAGCGHDSITAAIVRAVWELSIQPHMLAKLSGIGCSSKTPSYFVSGAHGFNSAHGRMPAIATGASAANRELIYIGVSGDGDSLSIGLGQLCHAIRRNLRMVYVIENNGVYGLTKGQFSASADIGSKSKKGEPNRMAPIDPVMLGLSLGATFIARSFSGDKEQLVPILKAGLSHRGLALIDVISPCVTFNDHSGSTKSYLYTRQHQFQATAADFVPPAQEILAQISANGSTQVTMHDGSVVRFTTVPEGYDPTDRQAVTAYLQDHQGKGEVVTGLLYLDESAPGFHEMNQTPDTALSKLPYAKLCPGSAALHSLMEEFRQVMPKAITPYVPPTYRADALNPEVVDPRIADVEAVARWFDYAFEIPGGFRFGLAGIIGLIPGIGDILDGLVSLYIVVRAIQLKIPRVAVARMLVNVGIEALAGSVPFLGDLFDIAFKANKRNYQLLKSHLSQPQRQLKNDWIFLVATVALVAVSIALPIFLLIELAKHL